MRRFAISDIHGCLATFKVLLEKIALTKEDKLYLLGDYVDRGPDSKGVIDHIWQLQAEGFQVHCLKGNHEEMILQCVKEQSTHYHGLHETNESFGVSVARDIPKKYLKWMRELDYYLEIDGFLLVHAGFSFKGDPLTDKEAMIWIREWYHTIDRAWLGNRIIVHGHTPTSKSTIELNLKNLEKTPVIDIDAGCVFNHKKYGHLCALNLDELTFSFQDRVEIV